MALLQKHEEKYVQTDSEEVSRQLSRIGMKEVEGPDGIHTFLNGGILVFAGANVDMSRCSFTDLLAV